METIPVNTGFPLPGSGSSSSRSTAVTGAAGKFRVVANLRMEGGWMTRKGLWMEKEGMDD